MQQISHYPGHQFYKQDTKRGVIAFMGQLYSDTGRKLPHDPKYLAQNRYTLTKEMANVFLNKPQKETKTCCAAQCGSKLKMNDRFCSSCGTSQPVIQAVAGDDVIVQFLQNIDPENPFALIDICRDRDISKAKPSDFMTKADVERIVQDTFITKGVTSPMAVPGEGSVPINAQYKANPFAEVTYSSVGG